METHEPLVHFSTSTKLVHKTYWAVQLNLKPNSVLLQTSTLKGTRGLFLLACYQHPSLDLEGRKPLGVRRQWERWPDGCQLVTKISQRISKLTGRRNLEGWNKCWSATSDLKSSFLIWSLTLTSRTVWWHRGFMPFLKSHVLQWLYMTDPVFWRSTWHWSRIQLQYCFPVPQVNH